MPNNGFDEFLQPKSMLTPGIAGALTMLITNALTAQFGLLPNYTGLAVSFLLGLVVFQTSAPLPWPKLVPFYLLNSLIIFSVAIGTNHLGVGGAKIVDQTKVSAETEPKAAKWAPGQAFFANWLDGTVKERQDLLAKVEENVNEEQAKDALKVLAVPVEKDTTAKKLLATVLQGARTTGDVAKVDHALDESAGKMGAAHAE